MTVAELHDALVAEIKAIGPTGAPPREQFTEHEYAQLPDQAPPRTFILRYTDAPHVATEANALRSCTSRLVGCELVVYYPQRKRSQVTMADDGRQICDALDGFAHADLIELTRLDNGAPDYDAGVFSFFFSVSYTQG